MSLSTECPYCGQRYASKVGLAGKQVNCKKCGKGFRIEVAKPSATSSNPEAATGSTGPQTVPVVSAGPVTSLKDINISTGPKPGPSPAAGVSGAAAAGPKARKGDKRLLVIASSAGGGLLVLIAMFAFGRGGKPASPVAQQTKPAAMAQGQQEPTAFAFESPEQPQTSVRGQQQPAVAEQSATPVKEHWQLSKPAVTPTTEVPTGVIAPADVDHRTVGGMKTPEQLFDDLTKQFDGVLPLLSAVRDEATLQDGVPKVAEHISKINNTLSVLSSSAMYGQTIERETVERIKNMQRQFEKRLLEETLRIGTIPGSQPLAKEIAKLGQRQPVPPLQRPDEQAMRALPPEEQIKWFMQKFGSSDVYAMVFEGLPAEDLPRIERRLGSFRNQGSPTFVDGDRYVKYISQVGKPEYIVNILNVGDARVNVAQRIVIIRVERAKLQLLPLPCEKK